MTKCLAVLALAACARETPVPPAAATATTPTNATTTHVTSAPVPAPAAPSGIGRGSYDEAMVWLKSTPSFRFVIDESGAHAEGTMRRRTVGAERVELRLGGETWRAEATPRGVVWKKGPAFHEKPAPALGNHLYQRVTFAFDPAKKEGAAQLVGNENGANHYRFTDANTGRVHDVWVDASDGHVERIAIAGVMDLKIEP